MSTVKDRVVAPRALAPTASLAERLAELGIKVPDQQDVKRMMFASRLGLPLDTPHEDMKFRLVRRLLSERWTKFELGQYAALTPNNFGAPMPQSIASHVSRVTKKIPGVKVTVYALAKDDPWVEYRLGDESFICHGWARTTSGATILV